MDKEDGADAIRAGLAALSRYPLRALHLSSVHVTVEQCVALLEAASMPRLLRSLHIELLTPLTDDVLRLIGRCSQLRQLKVDSVRASVRYAHPSCAGCSLSVVAGLPRGGHGRDEAGVGRTGRSSAAATAVLAVLCARTAARGRPLLRCRSYSHPVCSLIPGRICSCWCIMAEPTACDQPNMTRCTVRAALAASASSFRVRAVRVNALNYAPKVIQQFVARCHPRAHLE